MKYLVLICLLAWSTAYACTGFYSHDYTDGLSRICYYNHLGSTVAITVRTTQICPLTIDVSH